MVPTFAKHTAIVALLALPVAVAVAAAAPVPQVETGVAFDANPSDSDPSLTETYCDQRGTVADTLRHDFAEEPRVAALTGTGLTMELWTSDLMGTWTMVHHAADGISCIVTSGQDWSVDRDAVGLLDSVLAQEVHQS